MHQIDNNFFIIFLSLYSNAFFGRFVMLVQAMTKPMWNEWPILQGIHNLANVLQKIYHIITTTPWDPQNVMPMIHRILSLVDEVKELENYFDGFSSFYWIIGELLLLLLCFVCLFVKFLVRFWYFFFKFP